MLYLVSPFPPQVKFLRVQKLSWTPGGHTIYHFLNLLFVEYCFHLHLPDTVVGRPFEFVRLVIAKGILRHPMSLFS